MSSCFDTTKYFQKIINNVIESNPNPIIIFSQTGKRLGELISANRYGLILKTKTRRIPFSFSELAHAYVEKPDDFISSTHESMDKICNPTPTQIKKLEKSRKRAADLAIAHNKLCTSIVLKLLSLDGNLDNVASFVKNGVDPLNIIIVECLEHIALCMRIICPKGVTVVCDKLQNYLNKNPNVAKQVSTLYFDPTSKLQLGTKKTLMSCPNLKLYGITRAIRKPSTARPDDNMAGTLGEECGYTNLCLDSFGPLEYYDHGTVECWTFLQKLNFEKNKKRKVINEYFDIDKDSETENELECAKEIAPDAGEEVEYTKVRTVNGRKQRFFKKTTSYSTYKQTKNYIEQGWKPSKQIKKSDWMRKPKKHIIVNWERSWIDQQFFIPCQ
jgi:hypothetical protein